MSHAGNHISCSLQLSSLRQGHCDNNTNRLCHSRVVSGYQLVLSILQIDDYIMSVSGGLSLGSSRRMVIVD